MLKRKEQISKEEGIAGNGKMGSRECVILTRKFRDKRTKVGQRGENALDVIFVFLLF